MPIKINAQTYSKACELLEGCLDKEFSMICGKDLCSFENHKNYIQEIHYMIADKFRNDLTLLGKADFIDKYLIWKQKQSL